MTGETNGLEWPARDTTFLAHTLTPGDTDVLILDLTVTVVLYSIFMSNGGSNAHVISLRSGGSTTEYFSTYLPKAGGTAFLNLVNTEFTGILGSTQLYATCDAGGTGSVYLTIGYKTP